MKMVNIGCGSTFHPDWYNLDLKSNDPHVKAHDLRTGLPFGDETVDVVYSSHLLEHLREKEADAFLKEQFRVLKSGGIIRIVVPDLEVICRNYIKYLDELVDGDDSHEFRYDYSLLELFDQSTREVGGGKLGQLWRSSGIKDVEFVRERHGREYDEAVKNFQKKRIHKGKFRKIIAMLLPSRWICLVNLLRMKCVEGLALLLMGKSGLQSVREGIFRASGQIHREMYDRYRLKRLLMFHGFIDVHCCEAHESAIPRFASSGLDVDEQGIRKPDSLFMEATKSMSSNSVNR